MSGRIRGLSGYNEDYFEFSQWGKLDWVRTLKDVILNFIVPLRLVPFLDPRVIVDLGCGRGRLVRVLRFLGLKAYGLDLSPAATRYWHGSCVRGSVFNLPFRKVDIFISTDLFEHLPEDRLAEVMRMINFFEPAKMLHGISTVEEPWIYADATHITKKPTDWWKAFFAQFGWATSKPTDRAGRQGWFVLRFWST